ncbi:hypothetical protein [Mycolicibacterium fortuitum]|uniref:hypothetical protein n=1 Tax=Mycolicibacterium fortuitum TaxID=1766 RepID=UPI003AAAFE52
MTAKKAEAESPRGGGVDYRAAQAQRQAGLTDEQRQTYEQSYRSAGRAMDAAELIYQARYRRP